MNKEQQLEVNAESVIKHLLNRITTMEYDNAMLMARNEELENRISTQQITQEHHAE